MRNLITLACAAASLALLTPGVCRADLIFNFEPALEYGSPGSTVSFSAMLENTGSNTLYLNGDSFNLPGAGLTLDDSKFYNNFPATLTAGQSWTAQIFDVTIDPTTTLADYPGSFAILGGADAVAQGQLANQNFIVRVETAPVPEASTLLSLGGLLVVAGVCAARQRRRMGGTGAHANTAGRGAAA